MNRFTSYLTIALTAAALAATGASAHDGPDKGKQDKACRPAPVMLAGRSRAIPLPATRRSSSTC